MQENGRYNTWTMWAYGTKRVDRADYKEVRRAWNGGTPSGHAVYVSEANIFCSYIVKLNASLNKFCRGKLVMEVECQTLKLQ